MSCLGRAFGEEEWFNRYGQRAEGVIDRRIDARVRIAGGGVKSIDKSMAHLLPMLHGWKKLKGWPREHFYRCGVGIESLKVVTQMAFAWACRCPGNSALHVTIASDAFCSLTGFSDGIGRAFLRGVAYFSNVYPSSHCREVSASRSSGAFSSL